MHNHSTKDTFCNNYLQKGTTLDLQPEALCTPKAPYTPKASSRDVSGAIVEKCRLKSTNIYEQNNFRAKIIGRRIFQSILLNNNTLIINNTNEKNCCYFPIEYRSGNIFYCNKTSKIVVCDVTFFFYNLDVTALKSSRKLRVARCARMRENLVQFSSRQENQARIITFPLTFVNNHYQNYQVSLNYFF